MKEQLQELLNQIYSLSPTKFLLVIRTRDNKGFFTDINAPADLLTKSLNDHLILSLMPEAIGRYYLDDTSMDLDIVFQGKRTTITIPYYHMVNLSVEALGEQVSIPIKANKPTFSIRKKPQLSIVANKSNITPSKSTAKLILVKR